MRTSRLTHTLLSLTLQVGSYPVHLFPLYLNCALILIYTPYPVQLARSHTRSKVVIMLTFENYHDNCFYHDY